MKNFWKLMIFILILGKFVTNLGRAQEIIVSQSGVKAEEQAIAQHLNGNIYLVWQDWRHGNAEIYYRCFDSLGRALTGEIRLTTTAINSILPDISLDQVGNAHLVWVENNQIWYGVINQLGNKIISDRVVGDGQYPAITTLSDGTSNIVWEKTVITIFRIYFTQIDPLGNKIGNDILVSQRDIWGITPKRPDIAVDSFNNSYLVWRDFENLLIGIYYARINADRTFYTNFRIITSDNARYPRCTNSGTTYINIVYQDNLGTGDDCFYIFDIDDSQEISQSPVQATFPCIAGNRFDRNFVFAAWQDTRDGNSEIYAAQIDPNTGSLIGSAIRVTSNTYQSLRPEIITNTSDTVIVWQDDRSGNFEIYMTKIVNDTIATPVIIIPGLLGSRSDALFAGQFDFEPSHWTLIEDYYQRIVDSLTGAGFLVVPCPYDWRLSIPEAVDSFLIPKLDYVKKITRSSKVDIVAHSLGGLLSRYYILSDNYQDDIGKVILVGTPNQGAAGAYFPWEGGVVPPDYPAFLKGIFWSLIKIHRWKYSYDSNTKTVQSCFLSIQQLLPTYNYLKDSNTGDIIPENTMIWRNCWLADLNSSPSLLTKEVDPYQIIGTDQTTTPLFLWVDTSSSDWQDGEPVAIETTSLGDRTVLVSSAYLSEISSGSTLMTSETIHSDLLRADGVIRQIKTYLNPSLVASNKLSFSQKGINSVPSCLAICTPPGVNMLVKNPLGKCSGWDAVSSATLLEIPNSWYSGKGTGQIVLIQNPAVGNYLITLNSDFQTTTMVAAFFAVTAQKDFIEIESPEVNLEISSKLNIQFLSQPQPQLNFVQPSAIRHWRLY